MKLWQKIHNQDEKGQAIVLVALLMTVLLSILGLAIDGGGMMLLYRDAQNATDSAAVSAAYALCTNADPVAAAREALRLNGFTDGENGATLHINYPPTSGEFEDRAGYIDIGIEAVKPSYFIQIVYPSQLVIETSTVSQCQNSDSFGWPENSAVVMIRKHCVDSSANNGLRTTGNGSVKLINGGAFVNDTGSCDNVFSNGNGSFEAGGYGVCARGNINNQNGGIVASEGGSISQGSDCNYEVVNPDPFGLTAPQCGPDRGALGNYNGGSAQPGTYDNFDLKPKDNVHLISGIYCVRGGASLRGNLTSDNSGVLIYMMPGSGEIRQNGGYIDLHALRSHPQYTNLVIWADVNSSGDLKFVGNGNFGLEGTVYAPSRHCDLAGAPGSNTILTAQMICHTVDFTGNGDLTIDFDPSRVYDPPPQFGVIQ